MKRSKLILLLFVFIILLGLHSKAGAAVMDGCTPTSNFSNTTGLRCTNIPSPATSASEASVSSWIDNLFPRKLTIGSKGSDVKSLQQFLKDTGFLSGKIDGSYGNATMKALMNFQKANNINNSGKVDSETLKGIKNLPAKTLCSLIASLPGADSVCSPVAVVTPKLDNAAIINPALPATPDDSNKNVVIDTTPEETPKVIVTAELASTRYPVGQIIPVVNGIANNVTGLKYKFSSTGTETSVINELKFVIDGPKTVSSITLGGTKLVPVNGLADFTGLDLAVSLGHELTLPMDVSYATLGVNGMPSDAVSNISLAYIKYSTNGKTSTTCSATITICGKYIYTLGSHAPAMVLHGINPDITLNASNARLATGLVEIAQVKVVADKRPIMLKTFPIKLDLSNAELTVAGCSANGIVVKDSNDKAVVTKNTPFDYNNSGASNCSDAVHGLAGGASIISFDFTGYQIDTMQTFKIYVNINKVVNPSKTASASLSLGSANIFNWITKDSNKLRLDLMNNIIYFFSYPTNTVSISN